jgi:hypothetical protein
MDSEQAPSTKTHVRDRVPVAEGMLAERHGISTEDAALLLDAMAEARGTARLELASQIIDATLAPASYPRPYGTSFVDPSDTDRVADD